MLGLYMMNKINEIDHTDSFLLYRVHSLIRKPGTEELMTELKKTTFFKLVKSLELEIESIRTKKASIICMSNLIFEPAASRPI